MKKILLLVTGMSPQIVTETLYGLAVKPANGQVWIPDEVHVVSTNDGLNQIRDRLLDKGHFHRLLDDYQLPAIRFDESCLHTICTDDGQALLDLKTPEDNEFAANTICEMVRQFTEGHTELHVSIAGGRKTMGFYAGYALSLYGRSQDRMSHVLVEEKFEKCNDVINGFYYPTPATRLVFGKEGVSQDAKDAKDKIWLADIPFVRLRDNLPEHLLAEQTTFNEAVRWSNLANNQSNSLKVDLKLGAVWVHGQKLNLNKTDLAFLMLFVNDVLNGNAGVLAPPKKKDERQDVELSTGLKTQFLNYLETLSPGGVEHRTGEALEEGLFGNYFDVRLSNIRKEMVAVLGARLAQHYMPLRVLERKSKGGRMAGVYRLGVSEGAIEVIGRKMNDD